MIGLIVENRNPRIKYAADLVFSLLLGTDYVLLDPGGEVSGASLLINYTRGEVSETQINLPVSGLLYENEIRVFLPELRPGEPPLLFPGPPAQGLLAFDPFAAIFYLATQYDLYTHPSFGPHGRYDERKRPFHLNGDLYSRPLAHEYAEMLWEAMIVLRPGLSRSYRRFEYEITIDIDNPWKYRHKSLPVQAGGFFKDLTRGKWRDLRGRLKVLLGEKDPFDTFDLIREICPVEKTLFFFLIDGNSPHDSRFTFRTPAYKTLIQTLNREYRTGVHPSFETFLSPEKLQGEIDAFKELSGRERLYSRQHFLRYRLPDTFRLLNDLGIAEEYSLCPIVANVFPVGLCIPFPWFSLEENRVKALILHPGTVMDRSLMQYMGLSPEQALEEILRRIEAVRKVNGKFVIILHNETFGGQGEWTGWQEILRKISAELETNGSET